MDMIISNNIKMVLGNHELYFLKGTDIDDEMGEGEIKHQNWIKKKITNDQNEYLENCTLYIEKMINNKKILFIHFPIDYNSKDDYPFHDLKIAKDGSIRNEAGDLCIEIPNCKNERDVQLRAGPCHVGDKSYCEESRNQEWFYNTTSKTITSKMNGFCIEVESYSGPIVDANKCTGSHNQAWNRDEDLSSLKYFEQCITPEKLNDIIEVWAGELANGDYAVILLNRGLVEREIEAFWKDVGLEEGSTVSVRDLWLKEDLGEFTNSFRAVVAPHASRFLRITPKK
jgi:hypothetical protein